jgi:hypothetical protein
VTTLRYYYNFFREITICGKKKVPMEKLVISVVIQKSKQTADQADDRHVVDGLLLRPCHSSILIKYSPYTLSHSYPPPLLQKISCPLKNKPAQ